MKNTKWQLKILQQHHQSNIYYLQQCYDRFSEDKRIAWNNCVNDSLSHYFKDRDELDGNTLKIISYNKMMFTCGFYYLNDNHQLSFKYFSHRRTISFVVYRNGYDLVTNS